VYDELRRIAQQKMAGESPGQTLQVTSLVHEAYLRLIGDQQWENTSHFFGAAAESMRRILVDRARRKQATKRGGEHQRVELHENVAALNEPDDDVLAISESLDRFEVIDPDKAQLVKLRYFAGMTLVDAAKVMGISISTADRHWAFAKAWLLRELRR
jgi:RNA polymerase sigma factor (TIGR02999 family)